MPIVGTPIDDYNGYREHMRKWRDNREKAPNQGDPEKGMNALVDFVRHEGRATGMEGWPLWLLLGDDSIATVRARLKSMGETIDEWESIGVKLGEDDDLDSKGV